MPPASFSTADSPASDNLIAGEFPRATKPIVALAGENLVRGAVVGLVTVGAAAAAAAASTAAANIDPTRERTFKGFIAAPELR